MPWCYVCGAALVPVPSMMAYDCLKCKRRATEEELSLGRPGQQWFGYLEDGPYVKPMQAKQWGATPPAAKPPSPKPAPPETDPIRITKPRVIDWRIKLPSLPAPCRGCGEIIIALEPGETVMLCDRCLKDVRMGVEPGNIPVFYSTIPTSWIPTVRPPTPKPIRKEVTETDPIRITKPRVITFDE